MKFKHLLTVLLVLTICFSLCLVAVACGENKTEESSGTTEETKAEETKETESLLVGNGRFEQFGEGSAPNTATSWSGSTSDSTVDTVAGVVPMKQADYNAAMSKWNNLAYPGNVPEAAENNHVLLIYNSGATVYTYKPTAQLTTTIGAYYKYSVQLLVKSGEVGVSAGSGAYVTFTGSVYHQFGPFAETDGWQTITLYVAASQASAQKVNVALSLGIDGNPSAGYVFFDNVVAEKITAAQYAEADLTDAAKTAAYSMLVPDGNFINSTDTSAVKTPATWSGNSGKGNGSNANSTYVRSGIVTTDADGWAAWNDAASLTADNVKTPYDVEEVKDGLSSDGKILAISNDFALSPAGAKLLEECYTSYGFTNTMKMHIAPNTAYALSVWVYTDLNTAAEVTEAMTAREATDLDSDKDHTTFGANVIFSGFGDFAFNNIDTQKTWKKYTFYVIGSATRYKDVNVELWLGKGGMDDATRASGTVYFDNLTLTPLDYATREAAIAACQEFVTTADGRALVVNMTDNAEELIANGNFQDGTNGWTLEAVNGVRDTDSDVKTAVIDTVANADKDAAWWKETYALDANPLAPHTFNPVLMINNVNPSAYRVRTEGTVQIKANLFYRVAVWVKTADIDSKKGITVALMNADGDTALSSFSTVNTASYENEIEGVNGYEQLEFYVKGSNLVTENTATGDNKEVYILITFGTGNNFDTDEFLAGKVFIANVNMQQIDESEYSDHSSNSTYSKSYSFAASSGSTSGAFADSKFDVVTYDADKVNADGTQKGLYKPSSWTVTSAANVNAGILNVTQTAFVDELRTLTQYDFGEVYNAWADSVAEDVKRDYNVDFGAPNVFMAYTTKDEAVKAVKVLNNSSISLSTNKYYIIRCYVRAVGTRGQIEFSTTGDKESVVVDFGVKTAEDGTVTTTPVAESAWEEICFAVRTGSFGSVSATINVYLGNYSEDKNAADADKPTYQGVIFADSFTCYAIDEDVYAAFVGNGADSANFTTETFEKATTSTEPVNPTSWTGSGSSDNARVKGIYNRNYTTTKLEYKDKVKTVDEEGNEKTETKSIEEKELTAANVFDATGLTAGADLGNGVLVINNQEAGYYNYKSASLTLASKTAYALTLDARTFNIAEGEFARVRVSVGDDNFDLAFNSEHVYKVDEAGNYVLADGANVYEAKDSAWTRLSFYLQNAKSTSVTAYVQLMLGMSALEAGMDGSQAVRGTALFDNVTFEQITAEAFNTEYAKVYVLNAENEVTKDEAGNDVKAAGADRYQLSAKAVRISDDYSSDPEDEKKDKEKEKEPEKTDSSLLWLYITSIVIAGILIIVIVVWLIRRFMPKKALKRTKKDVDYDRNNGDENANAKSTKDEKKTDDEFKD